MNIVFVSTYETACGIATYTRKLAQALFALGHHVFVYAELDGTSAATPLLFDDVRALRLWRRGAPYDSPYGLGAVAQSIRSGSNKPDVIHVQHEFGLFPRTADLVSFAKDVGLPVVFTLHTVDVDHLLALGRLTEAGRCIVHSPEAQALLPAYPPVVVPHGVSAGALRDLRPEYLLVPGFIGPNKGTLEIVAAYWRALMGDPDYRYPLRLAGLCRDTGYETKLRALVHKYGLEDRVVFQLAYLSDDEARCSLSRAAAVILGGGDSSPYSASGQLHDAIGAGVPVLAKRLPIYHVQGDAGILYYEDAPSLTDWILAMESEEVQSGLFTRSARLGPQMSWEAVAKMTLKVYG